MAEQKRRWGDRRDATLLRDVDSLHFIMGIIYPCLLYTSDAADEL